MRLKAVIYMLLSAASFSMMQIFVASTAATIPLFEQLFFRNLVATFVAYMALRNKKVKIFGKKENQTRLFSRAFFGYLGMITTFYASGNGNQGDVSTILKMSPFIVTFLAFLFLKEKITKYQIIGLLVAFLGATFVANPQFNSNIFPIIVAMLAAIFAGIAYTMVASLKGREVPEVIIFYFSFFSTVVTLPLMLMNMVMPSLLEIVLLVCIGIFAALGQIFLTYSYAYEKASKVSIYNYSGIIFSMLFGYLFLGQVVQWNSIVGGCLVIIAGCIVYFGNERNSE